VTVIQQSAVGTGSTCSSGTCDVNFSIAGAGL
jgi:hypothetical protein